MSSIQTLQDFVDDELARMHLLIEQVLHAVIDGTRRAAPSDAAQDRLFGPDLQRAIVASRADIVSRFTESVRQQVAANLAAGSGAATASRGPRVSTLSLVDESEVVIDVEVSRTVEAINSVAEFELRELRSFTSALVGDVEVSRNTNPFQPEVYARALLAAAHGLALKRGFQAVFIRQATMPLAQALRKAFAAASTRLEDAGVVPGNYRTIILPPSSQRGAAASEDTRGQLQGLRDRMPVPGTAPARDPQAIEEALHRADDVLRELPADSGLSTRAHALDAQRMQLLASASQRVDQQVIELHSRLFDALLSERDMAPEVLLLLSRLQASALRVALHDPRMLESYAHPVWLFMDRMAFGDELHPRADDPLRAKLLGFMRGLIDNMVGEPVQDAALYSWGLQRLASLERHLFEQRLKAASETIADLQSLDVAADDSRPGALPAAAATVPLDVGSLDTVPGELLAEQLAAAKPPAQDPLAWVRAQRPGQWVRMFLEGRWHVAQLLWHTASGALWLYVQADDDKPLALRRRALERLATEHLLTPMTGRSLVQRAAQVVTRQIKSRGDAA